MRTMLRTQSLWCILVLLALSRPVTNTNPGVRAQITQQGLEYGRQIGISYLQQQLKSIKIPDISGSEKISPIGQVQYSLSGMQITDIKLPQSSVGLLPGKGLSLSIGDAFISLHGDWRVKYLRFIKDSGSFDLALGGLTIGATMNVTSDETGRPAISCTDCAATVGTAQIKFHGGASWLYNLFSSYVDKAIRSALQSQVCPLVCDAVSGLNLQLKTLNVLAQVDNYAEIEYSMVTSPTITDALIELGLKGEFYNIGEHREPPFPAPPFSLPAQNSSMLVIGLSSFLANSAAFVYHNAGVLSLYITDDMIPASAPLRLNTKTFGALIPQIALRFPNMMMKLLVKTSEQPTITLQSNNATLRAVGSVTAYAILPNSTLEPLFILNMAAMVSATVYISDLKIAGSIELNGINMTLRTSYVGEFEVAPLYNIFMMVLKVAVIPKVNGFLQQGYPLPSIGKMKLINTQLQILKDYILIGTDAQFTPCNVLPLKPQGWRCK